MVRPVKISARLPSCSGSPVITPFAPDWMALNWPTTVSSESTQTDIRRRCISSTISFVAADCRMMMFFAFATLVLPTAS